MNLNHKHNTAFILVTDSGFLVPTLVVCRQLLLQSLTADIVVYLVGMAPGVISSLAQAFPSINFFSIYETPLPENTFFHQNHVPPIALVRLMIAEKIPPQYENIVYLDGDLQIMGNLDSLAKYRVPNGKIAAGNGSMWLEKPWYIDYLAGLGNITPSAYFNSGVMAFRRDTWIKMAPQALQFFYDNSMKCEKHDQSALNAVFKGNTIELAPKYNFHGPYSDSYLHLLYKPAIIHFTGPNKPWKYHGLPWGSRFFSSYKDIISDYPFLGNYLEIKSITKLAKAKLWLSHMIQLTKHPHTLLRKHALFYRHIKANNFAF